MTIRQFHYALYSVRGKEGYEGRGISGVFGGGYCPSLVPRMCPAGGGVHPCGAFSLVFEVFSSREVMPFR
jgi:hypothetical protein